MIKHEHVINAEGSPAFCCQLLSGKVKCIDINHWPCKTTLVHWNPYSATCLGHVRPPSGYVQLYIRRSLQQYYVMLLIT